MEQEVLTLLLQAADAEAEAPGGFNTLRARFPTGLHHASNADLEVAARIAEFVANALSTNEPAAWATLRGWYAELVPADTEATRIVKAIRAVDLASRLLHESLPSHVRSLDSPDTTASLLIKELAQFDARFERLPINAVLEALRQKRVATGTLAVLALDCGAFDSSVYDNEDWLAAHERVARKFQRTAKRAAPSNAGDL